MFKQIVVCLILVHIASSFPAGTTQGQGQAVRPSNAPEQTKSESSNTQGDKTEQGPSSNTKTNAPSGSETKAQEKQDASTKDADLLTVLNPKHVGEAKTVNQGEQFYTPAETPFEEDEAMCKNVRCSKPDGDCTEIFVPPVFSEELPQGACCPVHSCRRPNGSIYIHYSLELNGPNPFQFMIPEIVNAQDQEEQLNRNQAQASIPSKFSNTQPQPQLFAPTLFTPYQQQQQSSNFNYNYNSANAAVRQQGGQGYGFPVPNTNSGAYQPTGPAFPGPVNQAQGSQPFPQVQNNYRFTPPQQTAPTNHFQTQGAGPVNQNQGVGLPLGTSSDVGSPLDRLSRNIGMGGAAGQVNSFAGSGSQSQLPLVPTFNPANERARRDSVGTLETGTHGGPLQQFRTFPQFYFYHP